MAADVALIAVFVLAALALRGLSRSTRRRAGELAAMDRPTIGDLHSEAAAVREQLGRGALGRPCKVVGVARPDGEPLVGPFSGRPVLWYDAKVVHHYWKDHYSTDDHGNQRHRRTRHQETLSHEVSSSARVLVDDGTGQVAVSLDGARLDGANRLVDQLRPHADGAGSSTIGYSYLETALLPGERLFVTGHLREQATGEGLEIVGAGRKGPLVSTRTEDEVLAGRRRVATAQLVGAVACAAVAVTGTVSTVGAALDDEPGAVARATARPEPAPSAATAPVPSPAGSAAVDFPMPDLVGADLQTAQDTVQRFGVWFSTSHDLAGSRSQVLDSNWQVCAQTPAAGTPVRGDASDIAIDFGVVRREERCP